MLQASSSRDTDACTIVELAGKITLRSIGGGLALQAGRRSRDRDASGHRRALETRQAAGCGCGFTADGKSRIWRMTAGT